MKDSFDAVLLQVHSKFLKAKRLRHYINGREFQKAFQHTDKAKIQKLIEGGEIYELKKYIESILEENLEVQKIGVLRELAKGYKIEQYYYLTRAELIEGIKNAKSNADKQKTNRLQG